MLERIAVHPQADVRLVGRLRVYLHLRAAVDADASRLRLARLGLRHVAQQLGDALVQAVAELAADADDHARGPVPVVDVRAEGVVRRAADRLSTSDDVPAERLIAEQEL